MSKKIKEQLKFTAILTKCFFHFLRRGSARSVPNILPKTVLVAQLAWLGDMVCTTPVFRAIKKKYPNCRVVVLGARRNKNILDDNKDVDRYIEWDEDFKVLSKEISSEKIDFACLATPHFLSLAYLFLLDIPSIVVPKIRGGFSPYETKSFKILRRLALVIPHAMGRYAPREYLRLLEPIDIVSEDTAKHLSFSEEAENKIKSFLKHLVSEKDFLIAISPSCGNKIKNWGAGRFALVADHLIDAFGAKVFVIGSSLDEKEVADMISYSSHSDKIINVLNKFSLNELKAFISKLNLFISVDTGPIYIAEAFGVPTVDIVGPMDEREQPPIGEKHKIVVSKRTKPELHVMNARVYNEKEALKQINDITSDMVIKEINDIISEIKKG